ncbi:hypothetical protein ACLMJK_009503 [Lecanora helva]
MARSQRKTSALNWVKTDGCLSQIFKHHISLIEGHMKMVDMVRKHTVEGTGNHRTIMGCVNRCREMMRDAKDISKSFVPPAGQRDQVPLGVSSESMYPGNTLKEHVYGKAAEEAGKARAEAKAQGIDINHSDVEYVTGQGKGTRKKTLAQMREAKGTAESGSGSGSDAISGAPSTKPAATNGDPTTETTESADTGADNPVFVIDTNPTPVNIPDSLNQSTKRSAPSSPEPTDTKEHKKSKKTNEAETPVAEATDDRVKFEDISEEVNTRLKEKEEKRRKKEEKKRKRESANSNQPVSPAVAPETTNDVVDDQKPKKKKKKSKHEKGEDTSEGTKKRARESEGASEDVEKSKKKKSKKHKVTDAEP